MTVRVRQRQGAEQARQLETGLLRVTGAGCLLSLSLAGTARGTRVQPLVQHGTARGASKLVNAVRRRPSEARRTARECMRALHVVKRNDAYREMMPR